MNLIVIYMVKVAIYMIAFYLVYSLILNKDTSHGRNRAFLIMSVISALLLPLITFETFKPLDIQFFGKFLSEVLVQENAGPVSGITAGNSFQLITSIYFSGVVILLLKMAVDLASIFWLIAKHRKPGSRIIRFQGFNTAGFSAMGYIFINTRLNPEEAGEIINHEKNHLKQNHYLDILFFEFVTAFQWFNPGMYLLNRELRAIHEFQADRDCLNSGIPIVNYQSLLLSQVFKSGAFKLSHSFSNPSLIRKRMLMMTKKRTSQIAELKLLMVLPVTALVFLTISPAPASTEQAIAEQTTSIQVPFSVVDEMPVFPGGDEALLKYIGENTIYPEISKEKSDQGRVIIRFCITEDGGVSQASILKGTTPELDAEAIRVVNSLPKFIPGRNDGKPVPVWYMVPITFTLK
jgi:TonB family protein